MLDLRELLELWLQTGTTVSSYKGFAQIRITGCNFLKARYLSSRRVRLSSQDRSALAALNRQYTPSFLRLQLPSQTTVTRLTGQTTRDGKHDRSDSEATSSDCR